MREDCRHFESRTYKSGEVARYCTLDLAPEAPWRCPESCERYQASVLRRTFETGSLHRPDTAPPPEAEGIAELLDAAEDIVNAAGPQILAEVEAERARAAIPRWRRVLRRRR